MKSIIVSLLLLIAIPLYSQQEFVTLFYHDAEVRGIHLDVVQVSFVINEVPGANARIDRINDKVLRITIDPVFIAYFGKESPQVQRLIYFLLGHELLKLNPGKGIMNPDRVYVPMKKKQIDKMFSDGDH